MINNPIVDLLRNRPLTDNRPILVGQAPNKNEPTEPLSPDNPAWSGARLARMAGLNNEEFRHSFFRVNVSYEPVRSFKVNEFSRAEARYLQNALRIDDRVILLGSAVQKCFRGLLPVMEPVNGDEVLLGGSRFDIHYFMIPHPSGVNRIYNDPTNVRIVGEFLRTLVQ